jgi:hypothetical protein
MDRIRAGFNVSYDSNSFQGIKNNLILQTKAGQNLNEFIDQDLPIKQEQYMTLT